MPPLRPWHTVPAPAPTQPSSKSSQAVSIACSTCRSSTGRSVIAFSAASLHSPTTGLIELISILSSLHRAAM